MIGEDGVDEGFWSTDDLLGPGAGTVDWMAPETVLSTEWARPRRGEFTEDDMSPAYDEDGKLLYPKKVDTWAMGIIWLQLLDGMSPFARFYPDETNNQILKRIAACGQDALSFPSQFVGEYLGIDAGVDVLGLVWQLLEAGPEERASAAFAKFEIQKLLDSDCE